MTLVIRELTDARDFATLKPMVAEYLDIISDTLVTNHQVNFDMSGPLAATMAAPENFVPPLGRTFLAEKNIAGVGRGFLKPMTGVNYEIKRLYVRPDGRGTGLGRTLLYRIMDAARELGGQRLFLDTLGALRPAVNLYEVEGFRHIDPYPESEVASYDEVRPHAVFMVKDL